MTLLTVKDLCIGYDGNAVADHINFSVLPGDYVCVLGENGAGKSTLIKTILSLLKPISGEFHFANGVARNSIGYLPQQQETQKDFPASVMEVVLSGFIGKMGFRPFFNKAEQAAANANIEKVGISHLVRRSFNELSGGQQQRVLLARALCATDKLLVLDEPTAGLDPEATANFYELINKLVKDGTAVIMVSHDTRTAVSHSTHILHLRKKHCCFGTTAEYIKTHGKWGEKENV